MIPKHAKQLLDEIEKLDYKPKKSEKSLIISIKRAILWKKQLTYGQKKWLEDIYKKAAGGGTYQQIERS